MNAPVLPKARMKVDEFLAWSERQPDDRYELVDGEIATRIAHDGDIVLDPSGLTVAVAALLGPRPAGGAEAGS